jgi:DASS family divalent anion:Na+ symporter
VGALYAAFLAMMLAAGVPSMLAALTLGYNANLFGTITHYASGPAAVYYASGYQKMGEVGRQLPGSFQAASRQLPGSF